MKVVPGRPDRCIALRRADATLADLLDAALEIDPDRTAIIFDDEETNYRVLDERANRLAEGMIDLGLRSGDRVAVQLENRPEFLEIFIAVMRAGGVLVPANVMYTAGEMRHILSDSRAKILFVSNAISSRLRDTAGEIDGLETVVEIGTPQLNGTRDYHALIRDSAPSRPGRTIDPDAPAVIQYTSGTTGKPKGAVVSHRNVLTSIDTIGTLPNYPIADDSVTLLCLPLFHTFGLNFGAGLTLAFGLTMVLVDRFDPERVFSLIEEHKVTLFWGVPPMYYSFVNTPGLEKYDVSSLRHAMTGAAILPVVIVERFRDLTGIELSDGYGMSETTAILTFNSAGPVIKRGSVGPPYPGVEMCVMDEHGQPLPVGEVGEICARGPNIFQGYWNLPEETTEVMRGGWLHTGDLGRVDEDGYFFIVGRTKDLIIVSGYNVYPIEVETVILRHPAVLDCAVIGIPDDYQGESVCAVIVVRPGEHLTESEVNIYCREHLAAFKCPRRIVFREDIPKSASGKILARVLRDEVR